MRALLAIVSVAAAVALLPSTLSTSARAAEGCSYAPGGSFTASPEPFRACHTAALAAGAIRTMIRHRSRSGAVIGANITRGLPRTVRSRRGLGWIPMSADLVEATRDIFIEVAMRYGRTPDAVAGSYIDVCDADVSHIGFSCGRPRRVQ